MALGLGTMLLIVLLLLSPVFYVIAISFNEHGFGAWPWVANGLVMAADRGAQVVVVTFEAGPVGPAGLELMDEQSEIWLYDINSGSLNRVTYAPDSSRGSFAMTGEGHGTKKAIVGGLLGYQPDDIRIRDSFAHAAQADLEFEFYEVDLGEDAHPNGTLFEVTLGDDTMRVKGCSIGGGRIRVREIDGFPVDLKGTQPTIVVLADDVPGTVSKITGIIAERGLNLATVRVDREGRGERALMTIETDEDVPADVLAELSGQPWVHWIRNVHRLNA